MSFSLIAQYCWAEFVKPDSIMDIQFAYYVGIRPTHVLR